MPRFRVNFRFLYRLSLRQSYEEGKLTDENYEILTDALRRPRRRKRVLSEKIDLMDEIEKYTMERVPKSGNVWEAIVTWLKENWIEIVKLLLSLLPLLLDEEENV